MAQFLEFISIDPWHLLFTWINLFILVMLLKKFLFKPVNEILAKRAAEVDKLYTDAEDEKAAAQASRVQWDEKLAGAAAEADALLKSAAERAQGQADALLEDTRRETARMRERAAADIAQQQLKARAELQGEMSDMVVSLAGKVIGRELSADDQAALIDGFIDRIDTEGSGL